MPLDQSVLDLLRLRKYTPEEAEAYWQAVKDGAVNLDEFETGVKEKVDLAREELTELADKIASMKDKLDNAKDRKARLEKRVVLGEVVLIEFRDTQAYLDDQEEV
jgi:hypothetical protein